MSSFTLGLGFIIFIASLIAFFAAVVWLIATLVSNNKVSRRKALKMLVISALGLLISFPLCTMGWGHVDFK